MLTGLEKALFPIVTGINEYLSSYILIILLIGVGLWYSIRTRFVQVRCFGEGMRKTFGSLSLKGGKQHAGMTSFQALATAIAAQVGTGNVVGASGAILTGGPGAIFWMWIIAVRIKYIPETFGLIFKYAFQPQAILGGAFGAAIKAAISQGAKRGLFSNEAGMGSTPHAHAQANVQYAHEQGVVAMTGVFIDTFIVLTLNALVIISTLYAGDGILASGVIPEGIGKTNLAQTAFGTVFGEEFGAIFVAVCMYFFAFSTILSWNLFGKINANYLFGKKNPKTSTIIYSIIAIVFIFIGTIASNDLVWELTDMFNNLMVLPNVIALFALTGIVIQCIKEGKEKRLLKKK